MSSISSFSILILSILFVGHTIPLVSRLAEARFIDPRCQAMRIPWCLGLYDSTIFPNFVGHQTQEDAYYSMHRLWPLVKSECSPQLLHYLCRLHAPQCPFPPSENPPHQQAQPQSSSYYQPELQRPPCEDACQTVRRDCHWILVEHEIHWPSELECHKLRNASCFPTPPQYEVDQRARYNVPPPHHNQPAAPEPESRAAAEPTTTIVSTTQELITEPVVPETTTIEVEEPTTTAAVETTTIKLEEPEPEPVPVPVEEEQTTTMEMTTTEEDDEEESTTAAPPAEPITPEGSLLGINPVIQEETTTSMAEGPAGEEQEEDTTTAAAGEQQEGDAASNRAAASLPVEGHSASEDGGEVIEPAAVSEPGADPAPAEAGEKSSSSSSEESNNGGGGGEEQESGKETLRSGHSTGDNAAAATSSGYSSFNSNWSDHQWRARMIIIYLTLVSVVYRYI